MMSTIPAEPIGAVAVIEVALLTVKLAAPLEPKLTADAPVRLVPVMVTEVPPAVGPVAGETEVTAGGRVPPEVCTETLVAAGVPAGATAVIEPELLTVKLVAGVVPK